MVTKHLSDSLSRLRRPYSVETAMRKSQQFLHSLHSSHSSHQALDYIKSVKQDLAAEAARLTVLNQQRKQLLAHKLTLTSKIRQVHSDIQAIKRRHEAVFNAASIASGTYLFQLVAKPISGEGGTFSATKKMMVIK